jgi:hypothetical protein
VDAGSGSLRVVLLDGTNHVRGAVLGNSRRDATLLPRLVDGGKPVDLARLWDPAM